MEITGKITGIKYKPFLTEELIIIPYRNFNINKCSPFCIVSDGKFNFAISKWVSPKRTRSYPYERIYNTLGSSKKITVIPIVKDEGTMGDRDFLQWDTVSLMSLLDVYVIFAYYVKAEKRFNKITNQQFDNSLVKAKIKEISEYHSSALHWNLDQLKNIHVIIDKSKYFYSRIEKNTKVQMHNVLGLVNFKDKIGADVEKFLHFSRNKAKNAQQREYTTLQPKELLSTVSKAKITIENYLGGLYFFTVDEVFLKKKLLYIQECKHTVNSLLPSKGDIKDGLLKMILYANLVETRVNNINAKSIPVLMLTSKKIFGEISSTSNEKVINAFSLRNEFSAYQKKVLNLLIEEARENNFLIKIKGICD